LGFAILANSRPWEGVWLGAGVLAAFVYQARRTPIRLRWKTFWTPVLVATAVVVTGMGYYNWRVFGSPSTLPYQINRATYAIAPLFVWQKLRPEPAYRHEVMRDFYVNRETEIFLRIKSVKGFGKELLRKIGIGVAFFFAAALLPPLIMLPKVFSDRRIRPLLIIGLVFSLGLAVNAFFFPRYAAPVACIVYAVFLSWSA
jgi:hypothetical protein